MLTVKQLSKLAGVTPRTLHHYDSIDLLKPSRLGKNGYRFYGEDAVLKLQQILFYRELGLRLEEINEILGRPDFDVINALQSHKESLSNQVNRLNRLIQTVDKTLDYLKGENLMSERELFNGFTEEEQEKYAIEAEQEYDVETVRKSNRQWKAYSEAEKENIMAEGKIIYAEMTDAMPRGTNDPQVQAIVLRWHRHIENFWLPTDDQLLAIANSYNDDPRLKVNFDKLDPKLAKFMGEAVQVYVQNRKKV